MSSTSTTNNLEYNSPTWRQILAKYHNPGLGRSIWQLANSIIPYLAILVLAYFSLRVSYFLTLALAIPAAGFLIRIFIIFHDCVHGSFFKSHKANDWVGTITGMITYTPYHPWKRNHILHHDTAGDLDRRGAGDVWTMTVDEYLTSSFWKRLAYRLYRNPIVMFFLGPIYVILIGNRLPGKARDRAELMSIHWTNLAMLAMVAAAVFTIGLKAFLLVQAPIIIMGFAAGFWLFYVQHQFEGVYWEDHEEWDFVASSMKGSSFYKLPKVLEWFTGRIGYHHIHHLCPRIPNYHLVKCYKDSPLFQEVKPVTLIASFRSVSYRFWDEENQRLVGYRDLRKIRKEKALATTEA